MKGPLAMLAQRGWLAATDNSSVETVEGVGPEAIYKLGFLNGLQAVALGANDEGDERDLATAAVAEAIDLLEPAP